MVRGSILVASAVVSVSAMKCPGSPAWFGHAKTQVVATADASCADVRAEIIARAGAGGKGWTDPHNGGIYAVLENSATEIETSRTANPSHSVGGQKYVDKQTFTLTDQAGKCEIQACSESQGTSLKDFSTNYCDIENLFCGSAQGCKTLVHDFATTETKVDASSGQHDFSKCIVKPSVTQTVQAMKCPGSPAWFGHAKTQVVATADASCADVAAEIVARAGAGGKGWTDPHNGGIYAVLKNSPTEIETSRTANPSHSVGGQKYVDKQTFTLTDQAGKCEIQACSESQGTSLKDFSTNYCDIENLFCGSAQGCKTLAHDFVTTQTSVDASSGQHDFSACIVKPSMTIQV